MEKWAVICAACALFGYIVASSSTLRADSSGCGQNLRDANEAVGEGDKDKIPLEQLPPVMTGLMQPADGLHPAERFLDPLALRHADGTARMARSARVERVKRGGAIL